MHTSLWLDVGGWLLLLLTVTLTVRCTSVLHNAGMSEVISRWSYLTLNSVTLWIHRKT